MPNRDGNAFRCKGRSRPFATRCFGRDCCGYWLRKLTGRFLIRILRPVSSADWAELATFQTNL